MRSKPGDDVKKFGDVATTGARPEVDGAYARYVLFVLVLVYVFNFVDRQILAILAEDLKADLGISDSQLGFLYGTAFAVFYATFGIALGRLADICNRTKLIAVGLGFWSVMTALSGLARGFLPLAACRFGVAVGEASATPASLSILYDYFSPRVRTTIAAIYSSGVYIGAGVGLLVGGVILEGWNSAWPDAAAAPLGLRGWQVAFMAVGLPGLLVAVWVWTLREPERGGAEGIDLGIRTGAAQEMLAVLTSMTPGLNAWALARQGRTRSAGLNVAAGAAIAGIASLLIWLTGSTLQWTALGIGFYCVVSWAQALAQRDPVAFGMMLHCVSFRNMLLASGATAFMAFSLGFWAIPFMQRFHGVGTAEAGAVVGVGMAVTGLVGVIVGGVLADRLKARTPRGKLYVWLGGIAGALIAALGFLTTTDRTTAYLGILVMYLSASVAHGPTVATINDLVLPRSRATATALFTMVSTFLGIALGPYVTGHLSDAFTLAGAAPGDALGHAMLWSLLFPVAGLALVFAMLPHIEADESLLVTRARALGEQI